MMLAACTLRAAQSPSGDVTGRCFICLQNGRTEMILRITELYVVKGHMLKLAFSDGMPKSVNVYPSLYGAVFEPLKDAAYFARVTLDPITGTPVWPNDADFAPEALRD